MTIYIIQQLTSKMNKTQLQRVSNYLLCLKFKLHGFGVFNALPSKYQRNKPLIMHIHDPKQFDQLITCTQTHRILLHLARPSNKDTTIIIINTIIEICFFLLNKRTLESQIPLNGFY